MSAHEEHGSGRSPDDELARRYREASEQDMSRPGAQVRLRVQQHAQAVLQARQARQAGKEATPSTPVPANIHHAAANQPRWKISLLASMALAALTGLLMLQFDRGTPEEKETAFGQPSASTTPAPAPAAAPTPTQLPVPVTPAPAAKAPPERPAVAAQIPAPTSEPKESRKAASTYSELAAESAQGNANRSRDTSDAREAGAAARSAAAAAPTPTPAPPPPPAPLAFPASPPATMNAAPAPQQRYESQAAQRASPPGRALADAPSPLLQAARSGSTAEITRLVQQGAAVNGTDEAGRTPLMLAVINGHETAVQLLISLGALRTLTDREGLSALDHARRLGLTGIAALLDPAR